MEFESKFPQLKFNYNLMGTLLYEPSINENACQINLDVMRKHYYQEILAAACLFFLNIEKNLENIKDSNGDIATWDTETYKMKGSFNVFPSNIIDIQWFLDDYVLASNENVFGLIDLEKAKKKKKKKFKIFILIFFILAKRNSSF